MVILNGFLYAIVTNTDIVFYMLIKPVVAVEKNISAIFSLARSEGFVARDLSLTNCGIFAEFGCAGFSVTYEVQYEYQHKKARR